jgi:hypothetical protein
MTFEERLEKMAERHEALAQTVELMAAENRDRDQRWGKTLGEIMEALARLLHIAEIHEHRLERLEGDQH